jgi:arylsulfatase
LFGLQHTTIRSPNALTPGKHQIKYEFLLDGPNPGDGGACKLFVDNQLVAEGKIPKTQPFFYSGDEGTDVGMDGETNVSNDYKEGDNQFTGKIHKITVEVKPK